MFLRDYALRRTRTGFIFLEILVAMAILSFGIMYIFRIFFGSMSALQHLKNRLHANLIIDQQIWEVKNSLQEGRGNDEYIGRKSRGENPRIDLDIRLKKIPAYKNLYELKINASWDEAARNIAIARSVYIRRL